MYRVNTAPYCVVKTEGESIWWKVMEKNIFKFYFGYSKIQVTIIQSKVSFYFSVINLAVLA